MHPKNSIPHAPLRLFYHPSMEALAQRIGDECERYGFWSILQIELHSGSSQQPGAFAILPICHSIYIQTPLAFHSEYVFDKSCRKSGAWWFGTASSGSGSAMASRTFSSRMWKSWLTARVCWLTKTSICVFTEKWYSWLMFRVCRQLKSSIPRIHWYQADVALRYIFCRSDVFG